MTSDSKRNNPQRESKTIKKDEPVPPDGGYGWVVLAASFFVSFILDGIMYSFGLVLQQIKLQFDVDDSKANWLNSLNTGFLFCSGPIVAGLANQFGCRVVVVGGAIITSLMYILTAFAPNIYVQMVTYGVIGGVSTGCTYIASIIVIAQYFEKKRGIATGICMAGSGVGSFVFAPLLEKLIKKFDWKFTLVVMGSIILQCAVLGCLLKPLKSEPKPKKKQLEMQNLIVSNTDPVSLNNDTNDTSAKPLQAFSGSIISLDKAHKSDCAQSNSFVRISMGILKEMTDFSLLKENRGFLLITLSNLFIFLGYFVPFLYIPEVAREKEIANSSWLLSTIGIVNIPFRMFYGFLADRKVMSATNLNTLAVIICTVPFFIYHFLDSFETQLIFAVAFAIGIAGMNSLTTMYLVELVGIKKFNIATGIINLFRGFGCFIGSPLAGVIRKETNSMVAPFYYSGILFAIGLLLAALISMATTIRQCMKKKNGKSKIDTNDALIANHLNYDDKIFNVNINDPNTFSSEEKGSTGLRALVRCAILATESRFVNEEEDAPLSLRDCVGGNDIDVALLKCCESVYPSMAQYRQQNRKVYEMPSNKQSKYQLYIYETEDNDQRYLVVMKGTLDIILQHCTSIFIQGNDVQMSDEWKKRITSTYQRMSAFGERVVCLCDIRLDPKQYPSDYSFDPDEVYAFPNLRFLGMISLASPSSKVKEIV